jgi:hypothetical protein
MQMDHIERRNWVAEVSKMNQRLNYEAKERMN